MANLPTPGGNDGTWGTILNEYLSVAHTSDGKLRSVGGLFVAASNASDASKAVASYVCDGTDDQVEIQSAIDSLPDFGGKVILSEGTFTVTTPITIATDGVILTGSGIGDIDNVDSATDTSAIGTAIVPTAAFSGAQVIRVQKTSDNRPLANIHLSNFKIDVDPATTLPADIDGILFRSYRGLVERVHIFNISGNGIKFQGYSGWNTYDTHVHWSQFGRCMKSGILFSSNTADMHLSHNITHGNTLHGLHFDGGGASMQITALHSYSNVINNVYMDGAGSRSKFVNCKFENSGQHNIYLDATDSGSTDIQFAACNFNSAGYSANNTYDNLSIQRASGGNSMSGIVDGCTFQWITTPDNGGSNKPRYHINLSGAVASNWRIGNSNKFDSNAQTSRVNHHANAVRCTVFGLGINAGDPTSAGQWTSNGEEGVMVVDTTANTVYIYANGGWRVLT